MADFNIGDAAYYALLRSYDNKLPVLQGTDVTANFVTGGIPASSDYSFQVIESGGKYLINIRGSTTKSQVSLAGLNSGESFWAGVNGIVVRHPSPTGEIVTVKSS